VCQRRRATPGSLRAILAKQEICALSDRKCKKRGCEKEKQPVDIWINHNDFIPPTGRTPPATAIIIAGGFPGSVSLQAI
jgi:hypothetical protein